MEAAEQLQLFLIRTQQKQEGMDDGDGGPRFLTLIAWKVTKVQGKQKHLANTWGKKTGGAEKYVKDTVIPGSSGNICLWEPDWVWSRGSEGRGL